MLHTVVAILMIMVHEGKSYRYCLSVSSSFSFFQCHVYLASHATIPLRSEGNGLFMLMTNDGSYEHKWLCVNLGAATHTDKGFGFLESHFIIICIYLALGGPCQCYNPWNHLFIPVWAVALLVKWALCQWLTDRHAIWKSDRREWLSPFPFKNAILSAHFKGRAL